MTKLLYSLFFTLVIALSSTLVTSCSTWTNTSEQPSYIHASLSEGKANFKAKKYSLAYRQLLPLAVKGSPDAQYAIGYMYYYGKGIDRNEELAENWLHKAASKGQSHAIAALKELSENRKNLAKKAAEATTETETKAEAKVEKTEPETKAEKVETKTETTT